MLLVSVSRASLLDAGLCDCLLACFLAINFSGENGWELHAPLEQVADLFAALMEEGKRFDARPFGSYALNSLRIEKGFRAWGAEVGGKPNTPGLSLNKFYDSHRHCFKCLGNGEIGHRQ